MISSIEAFFKLAMKRDLGELITDTPQLGEYVNVGSGKQIIFWADSLDYPEWDADGDEPIPYPDKSLNGIIAFHFLEHCLDPIWVLREFERVLKPGGVVWICVPYYSSEMAHHDLDHKHFFTEETWKVLLSNEFYSKHGEWSFKVQFNIIIGLVERNLCLLTQLVKE